MCQQQLENKKFIDEREKEKEHHKNSYLKRAEENLKWIQQNMQLDDQQRHLKQEESKKYRNDLALQVSAPLL